MIQKYGKFTPRIDTTCFIAPGSVIIGDVEIAKYSSVWHNAVIRGDIEKIVIGEYTNIQDCCILHCTQGIKIIIGNYVTIGHGAVIHSCEIGDNTLIGMGAIILDGARIGKNCLIGAGTVITPNTVIPDGQMVLGSPGKIKRELTEEEIRGIKRNSDEYVRLAESYANCASGKV